MVIGGVDGVDGVDLFFHAPSILVCKTKTYTQILAHNQNTEYLENISSHQKYNAHPKSKHQRKHMRDF